MPSASAKAMARIILVVMAPAASGLRPMAPIAPAPRMPMPTPGPMTPMAMASPAARYLAPTSERPCPATDSSVVIIARSIAIVENPPLPKGGVALVWRCPQSAPGRAGAGIYPRVMC